MRVSLVSSIIFHILISILMHFCSCINAEDKNVLVTLNESNWDQVLQGEWMLGFFTSHCPTCENVENSWKEFAAKSSKLGIKVGAISAISNPGLQARFLVTSFPSIFHAKDGVFHHYNGAFSEESFITFIKDKKWENDQYIPSWRKPQSIQMLLLSSCYKLAVFVWDTQDQLLDMYGMPPWATYILFILAFITGGTIVGLVGICIADVIIIANSSKARSQVHVKKTAVQNAQDDGIGAVKSVADLKKKN